MEIIHAFASCDVDSIPLATKLYVSLLLAEVSGFHCSGSTSRYWIMNFVYLVVHHIESLHCV